MTDVISENESLRNQVESVGEMTRRIVWVWCKKISCQTFFGSNKLKIKNYFVF